MVIRSLHIVLVGLIAMILVSCDATIHFYPQEPYPIGSDGKIRLNVDWSGYGKEVPTGMTVQTHHTETGEMVRSVDNNISYVCTALSEGRHWALVFNYSVDEFNYVKFRGLDDIETAEAYAPRLNGSGWYKATENSGGYLAAEPEWLAVDTIMTDAVDYSTTTAVAPVVIGTLHPENIIYTLHITLRSENISNMIAARGAISGMASGRFFAADCPNDNSVTVTHMIESDAWNRSRTGTANDEGAVKCDIKCFGLPSNHQGTDGENRLEFQAMLADGKTVIKYDIPVGDLIKEPHRPRWQRGDKLDLYLDLTLEPQLPPPDPDKPGGDWGFDVWVNDWEDDEDIYIPLNSAPR